MDVSLPDGTIIKDVPDGISKAELTAKLKANGYDVSKLEGEKPGATAVDRIKALQGGLYRGAAGLAGLPMDTIENAYNLAKAGVGTAVTAMGRPDLAPEITRGTPLSSEWIAKRMGDVGINTVNPRPDDPVSRMLNIGGMVAGGSVVPGATVKGTLSAATGGAIAGEMLGPQWAGIGAAAPALASQAVTGMRERASPIIETFRKAGAQPSLGQATDNIFLHGLENLAAKFPGGAGIMKRFIEKQQADIGATARTGVAADEAGRVIEKGITGKGGFLDRTKDAWLKLDNAVAAKVPPNSAFQPTNTLKALDDLTAPVQGAEKTTGALVNQKLVEMKANIAADLQANNGQIPFDAIRSLRTKVGTMLDDSLVSGIPGGELKRVYGALSKDLEAAATQAGAGQEFARQNKYYSARMDRIESVLERVLGKGKQPEDIFKSTIPSDPDQANKFRSVMRSLAPDERQVVTDAVVNRLGRAKPGKQNEAGEVFSSETFLSNWNGLSSGAKAQLFPSQQMRENIEKIAKASAAIRSGSGIYANPSGTAGSFAAYNVYLSPIAAIAAGSFAPLVAAGGAAGSALVGAKMLTNPKIIDWLAKPVNPANQREAVAHLARLGVIYNQIQDEPTKQEIATFVSAASRESSISDRIPDQAPSRISDFVPR